MELLREFRRRIWIILGVIVLSRGVAGAFSKFALTPQFKSITTVYILSKETTLASLANPQIGSQLTKGYKTIVTNRRVLNQVTDETELGLIYKDLKEKVTTSSSQDTRILSVSMEDPDPSMAEVITDEVATVSSDCTGDIMEVVPPKLIEGGGVLVLRSSPSNAKNTLISGLLGTVLTYGLITAQVATNNTICIEEDVTKYLGSSALASVPEREGERPESKETITLGKLKPKAGTGKSRRKKGGRVP